jgi:predicted nucleotidyltransferase component of viral defense system
MTDIAKELLSKIKDSDLFAGNSFVFVGGTALSYYLKHRISEDLDFACTDKLPVDAIEAFARTYNGVFIKDPHASVFKIQNGEDIKRYHMRYMINGVKVEFFYPKRSVVRSYLEGSALGSYENGKISIADCKTIAILKAQTSYDRSKIRDLFDVVTILDSGVLSSEEFFGYMTEYTDKNEIEIIKHFKNKKELADDESLYFLDDIQVPTFDALKIKIVDTLEAHLQKNLSALDKKLEELIPLP